MHLYLGSICSIRVFGQRIVILNSLKAATDLLEKRSSIYSDRPRLVLGGEMVGWDQLLTISRYGDNFREYRRLLHQYIGGAKQLQKFHGLLEHETHRFLQHLLHDPDHVSEHIRQ